MNTHKLLVALFLSALPGFGLAAPIVSVGTISGGAGASVNLPINFTADATGVSSLQFDLTLPAALTFVSASTGSASHAAGKSVQGSLLPSGALRILIFGLNQTAMGSGAVASVRLSIASSQSPASLPISIAGIAASDANGGAVPTSGTSGSVIVNDLTAPSTPASLSAVAVSSTRINISWNASTDNVGVAGYRILRGGVFLASTTATSFQNTGLTPSTAYTYLVSAYDAAGNVSSNSNSASATTLAPPDTEAPTVPGNLSAVVVSSTQINLSWNASTDNVAVAGYRILRGGVFLSSTTATTFQNTGLVPLTTYVYTVAAYDAVGNISSASSSSQARTSARGCDLNADTGIDVVDLQNMANTILAGTAPSGYDLNQDTQVNALDVQILTNVVLGVRNCPL